MDVLTHLFLPLTVAYVLRPDLFPSAAYLGLGVVGVLPDGDKLVGLQGALHAVIPLAFLGGVLIFVERRFRGEMSYALLVTLLMASHLVIDFLDGGPVLLLYPFVDAGVGLQVPAEIVLNNGSLLPEIRNPLFELSVGTPDRGRSQYPLVSGYGLLSTLVFAVIYVGSRRAGHGSRPDR